MLTKKGPPAKWVRYVILLSLPFKCVSLLVGVDPAYEEEEDDPELHAQSRAPLVGQQSMASDNSGIMLTTISSNIESGEGREVEKIETVSRNSVLPGSRPDPKAVFVSSWRRGSHSLDRISRVLFPLVFLFTIIGFFFTEKSYS